MGTVRNPANRDDQRRTVSSSVWLHVLLLVGLWSVALSPVSVVSVLATYALGLLYMLLALTAAVGGEVRILPSAAAAIGVCLLVFMSYSFAIGLSHRELQARLATGRTELTAVASAIRDYRSKRGEFPGPGDWTAKFTEGEERLWVSKIYGVPLLYQNRASSEQAMPCSYDSLSCLELAPDVYLWSPGVLLDARELQRRNLVSLIGRIVLWAMAGLFALCLLALLGFSGLRRPQCGRWQ